MKTKLFFLHALSPLHAGTGQGVGVIDLPIARERATGIPFVPGSSVKGVLRDSCDDEKLRTQVFGPEFKDAAEYAGSAQFSDVRLLLLPVRSITGVFAWITSPLLLRRLQRDCTTLTDAQPIMSVPMLPSDLSGCIVANNSEIVNDKKVILEDIELDAQADISAATWAGWLGTHIFDNDPYWHKALAGKLCIVHDDVLSFLLQTATEVTARIRMDDDTKTVADGALWYEESLPAETILSGLVMATPIKQTKTTVDGIFATLSNLTKGKTLQVGGNATVGRGLCQIKLVNGAN